MMIGTRERVPDLAAHVDPRDLRQHDVEEHERRLRGVESLDRLRTVGGGHHEETLALQA